MARVTAKEVRVIIDTDINLEPHIAVAHLTINQHLINKGLSAELLKEIERWLAAHFAAVQDPSTASEGIAGLRQDFGIRKGLGLDLTEYGQQARVLDPTGTLAKIGSKKAEMRVF